MSIDFWGLGLQAVNVLILVWVLSRVLWRPIAGAIAQRQQATQDTLDSAKAAQDKADAALAEVTQTRAGMAEERAALLADAAAQAEVAAKATLSAAREKAEALLSAAQATIAQDTDTARRNNAQQAVTLSVEMAGALLARLDGPAVEAAFLAQLAAALAGLPDAERETLRTTSGIQIVTAHAPNDPEAIRDALRTALGDAPALSFTTNPALLGGIELHSAHFVLRNSWQSDLAAIVGEVSHAD